MRRRFSSVGGIEIFNNTVDTAQALHRLSGNKELYVRLVDHFLNGGKIAEIKESFSLKHVEEARRHLHSVKGVAANLGFVGMAELAGSMESQVLRDGEITESCLQMLTQLETFFLQLKNAGALSLLK